MGLPNLDTLDERTDELTAAIASLKATAHAVNDRWDKLDADSQEAAANVVNDAITWMLNPGNYTIGAIAKAVQLESELSAFL